MASDRLLRLACLVYLFLFSVFQVHPATASKKSEKIETLSPFASALDNLQKQISYNFTNMNLLRRAMTHSSFSEENNKALAILGTHIIETSVAFHSLKKDIDVSSKDLNHYVSEISNVDSSCSLDGKRLGLQKVIRVSSKTDPANTGILCGAFRAMFGAVAIDSGRVDDAINLFWKVHGAHTDTLASL